MTADRPAQHPTAEHPAAEHPAAEHPAVEQSTQDLTRLDDQTSPAEGANGLDRLVFFSDAVVAIAITLVVLPLVDSARDLDGRAAVVFLHQNANGLIAAAISFGVIGGFWREHHRMFSTATGYTRRVMQLNLYWLGGIMAVPVVTVLVVSGTGSDRVALGMYLGVILIVRLLLMGEELLLAQAGLIGDQRIGPGMLRRNIAPAGLILVALVTTMVMPGWGMWPVLVLALDRPLRLVLAPKDEAAAAAVRD